MYCVFTCWLCNIYVVKLIYVVLSYFLKIVCLYNIIINIINKIVIIYHHYYQFLSLVIIITTIIAMIITVSHCLFRFFSCLCSIEVFLETDDSRESVKFNSHHLLCFGVINQWEKTQ